jgi:outer membrane protein W
MQGVFMKKQALLWVALVLAMGSTSAMAQGFLRAEAGRSDIEAELTGFEGDGDKDSTYSFRAGYYFNPQVAVEGFYSRFYDESITFDDGGDPITVSGKLSGIGLGVVGKTHFGTEQTGFFISGRVGVMRGEIEASVTGFGSESDSSTKPYFGVGAGYDFSESFGVSLNYDQYKGSGEDLSITAQTFTVGLEARF